MWQHSLFFTNFLIWRSTGSVLGRPLLFIMYTTRQLATLALSLVNISPSLTKSRHFLNPAILKFVHFVVSVLTSIKKQPVPSPSIVHSKLDYCNSLLNHNLPNSQLHRLQLIQNSCPHCFQYS